MCPQDTIDPYSVLGIPVTASAVSIRTAYRRLALKLHPDRAGSASTRAFQRLAEAYAMLTGTAQRVRPQVDNRTPKIMLSRLSGALASLIRCGAARYAEGGLIELLLIEDEAESGGYATISVPVPELLNHWVTIPAGVADGFTVRTIAGAKGSRSELQFRIRVL